MRAETYDKKGLAEVVEILRVGGKARFRRLIRLGLTVAPIEERGATPEETARLEAEEAEQEVRENWKRAVQHIALLPPSDVKEALSGLLNYLASLRGTGRLL